MPVRRVCVVGGGVVGLSCAWWLARAGCAVEVVDPAPGAGASHAAAGMLAPVSEVVPVEDLVLRFGLASLAQWPDFASALESESSVDIGLRSTGTLLVAHDRADAADLTRFATFLAGRGLRAEPLTGKETRVLEPALSPRIVSGLHVGGDLSVDNRAMVRALLVACQGTGVRLHRDHASLLVEDGQVCGVATSADRIVADRVVVAAGYATEELLRTAGLDRGRRLVRPVKGQILRLAGPPGLLQHTVRARVGGDHVYLVPRDGGEVVVGATSEDVGPDTRVTAEAVHWLLQGALAVVPGVAELELRDSVARLRPATPDNAPVIGATATTGLLLATGHFRGGVLMAPATAQAITAMVLDHGVNPLVSELSPLRFATPDRPARLAKEATW